MERVENLPDEGAALQVCVIVATTRIHDAVAWSLLYGLRLPRCDAMNVRWRHIERDRSKGLLPSQVDAVFRLWERHCERSRSERLVVGPGLLVYPVGVRQLWAGARRAFDTVLGAQGWELPARKRQLRWLRSYHLWKRGETNRERAFAMDVTPARACALAREFSDYERRQERMRQLQLFADG